MCSGRRTPACVCALLSGPVLQQCPAVLRRHIYGLWQHSLPRSVAPLLPTCFCAYSFLQLSKASERNAGARRTRYSCYCRETGSDTAAGALASDRCHGPSLAPSFLITDMAGESLPAVGEEPQPLSLLLDTCRSLLVVDESTFVCMGCCAHVVLGTGCRCCVRLYAIQAPSDSPLPQAAPASVTLVWHKHLTACITEQTWPRPRHSHLAPSTLPRLCWQ